DTSRLGVLHAGERGDDAEHSAEETDERSGRTDGRQTRQPAPELRALNRNRTLQRTLRRIDLVAGDVAARFVRAKLLQARIDDHRQMRLLVLVADVDGLFDAVVLQSLRDARREFARLRVGGASGPAPLVHD